ncbi:hypothetical protein Pstu01_18980 [Stutzerimonas stutzeri]|nr:hypothetical protein Pstu01_18980 [Stutzerimonas stutzeri]
MQQAEPCACLSRQLDGTLQGQIGVRAEIVSDENVLEHDWPREAGEEASMPRRGKAVLLQASSGGGVAAVSG